MNMTCRLCNDLCLPGCLAVSWPKYDLSRHASNLNTSTSQAQSGQHNQTWIGDACKLRLQHASALKNRRKRTISRTDHCIVCRCCRKKDTQQLKLSFWLSSVDTGRDCCQQSIRLNKATVTETETCWGYEDQRVKGKKNSALKAGNVGQHSHG